MHEFDNLLSIARRKNTFDEDKRWGQGSSTYLTEIKKEVDEVIEEIPERRRCYLEDELGDILWDYLNVLLCLETETGVEVSSVLKRACRKYEERISGVESGERWSVIKERQKISLAEEFRRNQTRGETTVE